MNGKVATFCGSSLSTYNTALGEFVAQENLLWRKGRSNFTQEVESTALVKGSIEIISAHVIPHTKARSQSWRFAFFIFFKASCDHRNASQQCSSLSKPTSVCQTDTPTHRIVHAFGLLIRTGCVYCWSVKVR